MNGWAEYERLNEDARRAYAERSHSSRSSRPARVPMAEGCTGVLPGSSFAYGCRCEHCLPRLRAIRAAARETKQTTRREPDMLSIELVFDGHRMDLPLLERREAVRLAVAKGRSAEQIALMLGRSRRSVQRHVARLRREGALP